MFADFEGQRRVAETFTEFYRISTVFLGLDHGFSDKGPPILFETMVFELEEKIVNWDGKEFITHEDVEMNRYASWDDAITGHKATVSRMQRREAAAKVQATFATTMSKLPKVRKKDQTAKNDQTVKGGNDE